MPVPKKIKRVTIKDVAARANVSTGTVDRVIHKRGRVAKEVKDKVLRVMEELGFERNMIASTLAKNISFRIAVLLPDYNLDPYWEQPFAGVEAARKLVQHYSIVIEYYFFELQNPKHFKKVAKELIKSRPDGVLFPPLFLNEGKWLLDECNKTNTPCVIFNTNIQSANKLSYIGQDSYQSGVLAARLLNFGMDQNDTAVVLNLAKGSTNARHLVDKKKGFANYFENNAQKKIEILDIEFEDFNEKKKLKAFLMQLIKEHPKLSGIFFTNSRAYKAIECLDDEIVKKIKIIGFDLIEQNLKFLSENKINFLINQNPIQQGFLGVQTLYKHLALKEEVDLIQYLPLDIVVKENVEYYNKRGYPSTVYSSLV